MAVMFSRVAIRIAGLIGVILFLAWSNAVAADPSIRLSLPRTSMPLGDEVEMIFEVEGGSIGSAPVFSVDGLEIENTGTSSQMSFINGRMSQQVTYSFVITAKREGEFLIPEKEFDVGGRKVKSNSVTLKVTAGTAPGSVAEPSDEIFAEIRLEKKMCYVGETVPIEFRIYIAENVRWQMQTGPKVSAEGFTTHQMSRPEQRDVELAGKNYRQVGFHTLVTPSNAGELSLGPITVPLLVQRPSGGSSGIFPGQRRGGRVKQIEVTAPAVAVQVKPLPIEGKPDSFTGAIGTFQFSANGKPDKINAGQPLEIKMVVSGRGNFDRIGAPQLQSPKAWQTYPAEDEFAPSDPTGISGTKTFKQNVVPLGVVTTMPVYEFSYFDPDQAKYVRLTNQPGPLTVVGAVAPPQPDVAKTDGAEEPVEPEKPKTPELVGILPEPGSLVRFGLPVRPAQLLALALFPLPLMAGLIFWKRRKPNPEKLAKTRLRHTREEWVSKMQSASTRGELLDAAAHVLRLSVALTTPGAVAETDDLAVVEHPKLPEVFRDGVREIFQKRTELVYSGAGTGTTVSGDERNRVMETVEIFQREVEK